MLRKFAGVLIATALVAAPAFAAQSADHAAGSAATAAADHHAAPKHGKSAKHTKTAKQARKDAHKHVAHGKLHRVKQVRHLRPAATHKAQLGKTAKVIKS